jgi:hypothetical protein
MLILVVIMSAPFVFLFIHGVKSGVIDLSPKHTIHPAGAYMDTSFVVVEKPSDGSRTPYYIEDMMPGTGYHRAINVYTGEEELIRESNVIEVL